MKRFFKNGKPTKYGHLWDKVQIDPEDAHLLDAHVWRIVSFKGSKTHYVMTGSGQETPTVLLHRMIAAAPEGMEVDHINGDGLDNRRENLRVCTHHENMRARHRAWGSSDYKGVSWHKQIQKWRAFIGSNGRILHLGCFTDEKEAARAYNEAALKYFGEFAVLNEVDG